MTLNDLAYDSGDAVYYTSGFRTVLQSYFMYFKDRANNLLSTTVLEPLAPIQYEGDLNSLLLTLDIPAQYHWFIMLLNGMQSPSDFGPDFVELDLPDIATIERIKNTYLSTQL